MWWRETIEMRRRRRREFRIEEEMAQEGIQD